MELIYFWFKNETLSSEGEYNFSACHNFSFDESKKILSGKKLSDDFNVFSYANKNISNVNALVGDNGSGKTIVLKMLADSWFNAFCKEGSDLFINKYILLFLDNNKYYIKCCGLSNLEYLGFKALSFNDESKPCFIMFTNAMQLYDYIRRIGRKHSGIFYDFSLSSRLQYMDDSPRDNNSNDRMITGVHNEMKRQVKFWFDCRKSKIKFPFKITNITLKKLPYDFILNDMFTKNARYTASEETSTKLTNISSKLFKRSKLRDRFEQVLECVQFSLIYRMLTWYISPIKKTELDNKIVRVLDGWDNLAENNCSCADDICKYVDVVCEHYDLSIDSKKISTDDTKSAYRCLIEILLNDNFSKYYEHLGAFRFNLKEYDKEFYELYNSYDATAGTFFEYFSFEWGTSTGEYAFFNLYSVLWSMGRRSHNDALKELRNTKDIFIALDEADLYLHPQWQRTFVNELINRLPKFFTGKKIQLLITTHSPIFLSDIPNTNVIYLSHNKYDIQKKSFKQENEKTFFANIYALYKNSFFWQNNNGICTTGEFALSVVDKMNNNMNKALDKKTYTEKEMDEWEKIINLIGDSIIKKLLMQKLELIRELQDNK